MHFACKKERIEEFNFRLFVVFSEQFVPKKVSRKGAKGAKGVIRRYPLFEEICHSDTQVTNLWNNMLSHVKKISTQMTLIGTD